MTKKFTEKQGQYLAYIHSYLKLHRRAPAEADIQYYFRVTPPTVHQMILKLEEKGFISRTLLEKVFLGKKVKIILIF